MKKKRQEHVMGAAHGASIGSGRVVMPDALGTASSWAKGLGRKVRAKDRSAWDEHAKRLNMLPGDAEKGWAALQAEEVFDDLHDVFGESTSWSGFALPNLNQVKMQPSTGPASMRTPEGPGWGSPSVDQGAFPFHTASAGKVWQTAKKLMPKNKHLQTNELLRLAIDDSGVLGVELTPEDSKLLGMAIDWARNGPPFPVSQMRRP